VLCGASAHQRMVLLRPPRGRQSVDPLVHSAARSTPAECRLQAVTAPRSDARPGSAVEPIAGDKGKLLIEVVGTLIPLFALSATLFGPLTGWYAGRRDRHPVAWLVFGALLGPIALLILAVAPPGRCPSCDFPVDGWPSRCPICEWPFSARTRGQVGRRPLRAPAYEPDAGTAGPGERTSPIPIGRASSMPSTRRTSSPRGSTSAEPLGSSSGPGMPSRATAPSSGCSGRWIATRASSPSNGPSALSRRRRSAID
jgi:hypothetical protein